MSASAPDPLEDHYKTVIKAMVDGRLVPFFGAAVNLCGRPKSESTGADTQEKKKWRPGCHLPDGKELSAYLAEEHGYPKGNDASDLARVSQYITVMTGSGPLYENLHALFDRDYEPTPLHEFFASLPGQLRDKGYLPRHQLIVTTNYDDLMERAFREAEEEFDLVSYIADGEQRGKFLHWPPEGDPVLIERPNEYRGLSLERCPVVLKIHGAVHRGQAEAERDSYVITEDHYIDYLTRTDLSNLVPVTLAAKLKKSHFLFLGYSLRDWNLRVILHRIWGEQKLSYKSWAIQLEPQLLDQKFWGKREVDILDVDVGKYIVGLDQRLRTWSRKEDHP